MCPAFQPAPPLRFLVIVGVASIMLGAPSLHAKNREVRMLFVGDVLLGASLGPKLKTHGAGYPSQHVRTILSDADLVFGNLECPLTTARESTKGKSQAQLEAKTQFIFKADPILGAKALQLAGFTVMSVANNHSMDYRGIGMMDTIATLDDAGIVPAGGGADWDTAAAPRILTMDDGSTVGVLACSMINPPYTGAGESTPGAYAIGKRWNPFLEEQIELLDQKCDFVVLSVHWGIERNTTHQPYQTKIAHAAIDAGADAVIGHHTHCLQPFEWYDGKLIAYSLGNFIFTGQSKEVSSAILEIHWTPGREDYDAMLHPVLVRSGVPEPTADATIRKSIAQLAPDLTLLKAPVESD